MPDTPSGKRKVETFECDCCGDAYPIEELVEVELCRQTHESPAEWGLVCEKCIRIESFKEWDD